MAIPRPGVDQDAGDDDVGSLVHVGIVKNVTDAGTGIDLFGDDQRQQRSPRRIS